MVDLPSADIVFLYLPQERAWQGATLVNSERPFQQRVGQKTRHAISSGF